MLGFKGLLVDTHDDGHIGAVRGGGYDHSLCSGLEMLCRSLAPGENTGAFERDIDPELAPGQLRRSRSAVTRILPRPISIQLSPVVTSPGKWPCTLSYLRRCALVSTGPRSLTPTTSISVFLCS